MSPPSTSIRAARWTTASCSAIAAAPRPGGWRRWCGWSDHRGGKRVDPTGSRSGIDATLDRVACAARRGRRGGRVADVGEIELLPITKFFPATDVAILSRLGCPAFGESREQEASEKVDRSRRRLLDGPDRSSVRWHMVGRIQRNKARSVARWAYAAHSVDSAGVVDALGRAVAGALSDGRRTESLRVYVQVSLDGDLSRGGIDVVRPAAVDEVCAQVDGSRRAGIGRADGHPAAGMRIPERRSRVCSRSTIGCAGSHPRRVGSVGGNVGRPGKRGQTRFDVCACRYRAIGSTAANVTLSSHSSHIFITDTGNSRA